MSRLDQRPRERMNLAENGKVSAVRPPTAASRRGPPPPLSRTKSAGAASYRSMPVRSTPPHPSEKRGSSRPQPSSWEATGRINYYPNGDRAESKGYVSVFLFLDEDVAKPATARCQLTLVVETRDAGSLFIHRKEVLLSKPEAQHDFTSRCRFGYTKFAGRQSLATRVRRGGDRFTIRYDVIVVNGFRTEEATPSSSIPPSDLHKYLGDLLQSGRGADVVFEVGGETFAAHRCVLAARSPVISPELLGTGSDGAVAAGAIRVDGVDPPAFRALLRYAYTDLLPEMNRDEEDAVLRNLLAAADRYSLNRLKLICEDKLGRLIDVGTVQITLKLAERHGCNRLNEACLHFLGAPGNLRAAMGARGQ